MLMWRCLCLERQILLEKCFEVAKDISTLEGLENIGSSKTILLGPHRFINVTFYASLAADVSNSIRKSSLSLLQMYLSSESLKHEESDTIQSAASNSIKEMLARNPSLVQLLNGTLNFNSSHNRRQNQPITRSRMIYFTLEGSEKIFVFPYNAIIEPLSLSQDETDLLIDFNPVLSNRHPLKMIIRCADDNLRQLLVNHTKDPVKIHSEFLPRISHLVNIPYREICFPCHPPSDIASLENLVKQYRAPDSTAKGGLHSKSKGSSMKEKFETKKQRKLKRPDLKSNEVILQEVSKEILSISQTPINVTLNTSPGRHCGHCGARNTPMWRRGPEGPSTLCNACGVKWKNGKLLGEPTTPTPKDKLIAPRDHIEKEPPPTTTTTIPVNFAPIKKRKYTPMTQNNNQLKSNT